jgi:hypothetical protein
VFAQGRAQDQLTTSLGDGVGGDNQARAQASSRAVSRAASGGAEGGYAVRGGGRSSPDLSVGFSTVPDGYHFYHLRGVVHNVKDAIVSHPKAVFLYLASELSYPSRPGVLFESQETFRDSIVDMVGKVLEFFLRRPFQANRIVHVRPLC